MGSQSRTTESYAQPKACPTCQGALTVSAVACDSCGTEVHGHFRRCEFCGLDDDERGLLRVFLATRGNIKEIERYLGVSYPTARARVDGLISAVDANGSRHRTANRSDPTERRDLLDQVAAGTLDVGVALDLLAKL
jgi:hypothetical protein